MSANRLPFLFALQFCPEDKPQAMALASLIADLEPGPNKCMNFMFCPRFDTLVDSAVELRVRQKFPDSFVFKSLSRTVGWPAAPNAMVHEIYSQFHRRCNAQGMEQWEYCALMFGEPDCVPLARDWAAQLQNEWYACDWRWPLGSDQLVLGHWLTFPDSTCPSPHINGNCMISPRFLRSYPAFRSTSAGAWDTTHARAMLAFGRPSKLIFSDYHLGHDPRNPFRGCADLWKTRCMHNPNPLAGVELHPVYLHGLKDMRAIDCVRAHFNLGAGPAAVQQVPRRVHANIFLDNPRLHLIKSPPRPLPKNNL